MPGNNNFGSIANSVLGALTRGGGPGGGGGMGGGPGGGMGGMGGMGGGPGGGMGGSMTGMTGGQQSSSASSDTQAPTELEQALQDRWEQSDTSVMEQVEADWDNKNKEKEQKKAEKKRQRQLKKNKKAKIGKDAKVSTTTYEEVDSSEKSGGTVVTRGMHQHQLGIDRMGGSPPPGQGAPPQGGAPPQSAAPSPSPAAPAPENPIITRARAHVNYLGLTTPSSLDVFITSNPINSAILAGDSLSMGTLTLNQLDLMSTASILTPTAAPGADTAYMDAFHQQREGRKYDVRVVDEPR